MQRRRWSAAVLKWIAVVTMTIDHIGAAVIEQWLGADGLPAVWHNDALMQVDVLLREIGRIAFPIFCFLLVEGFIHTHDRRRYAGRLLIFGIISQLPFQLALYWGDRLRLNVMFTLLFGLLAIWAVNSLFHLDEARGQRISSESGFDENRTISSESGFDENRTISSDSGSDEKRRISLSTGQIVLRTFAAALIVLGLCILAFIARSDYNWGGIFLILILFLLKNNPVLAAVCGWICITFYSWVQSGFDPQLPIEVFSFIGFYFCLYYNGERGRQSRYFFYIYYPAHLMALWLIRVILN